MRCLPRGTTLDGQQRAGAPRPASCFKPRGKLTDFSFMAIARSIVACFSGAAFSFVAIKPWSLCSAIMSAINIIEHAASVLRHTRKLSPGPIGLRFIQPATDPLQSARVDFALL